MHVHNGLVILGDCSPSDDSGMQASSVMQLVLSPITSGYVLSKEREEREYERVQGMV